MRLLPFLLTLLVVLPAAAEDDEPLEVVLARELQRTNPDYVVYVPGSVDGSTFDTGNEHFLVFDGPDSSLMAVWTQSSYEGAGDHRIMFSRSEDGGKSWSEPQRIAGATRPKEGLQASWGFPMVSESGRIYVVWNQYQGIADYHHQITGTMDACYSDDHGATWSEPQTIPMQRGPYDHPDVQYPSNWIVWQKPIRARDGKWFTGFTRWVSPAVRTKPHINSWTAAESVVEFMRFENIDDDPEPKDIRITWSDPGADQPIWFSESKELMDNDGVGIGPLTRTDIGVYPSTIRRGGEFVLWHPDRKFFLVGKVIGDDWLAGLQVPE